MEGKDIGQMSREELDELAETLGIKANGNTKDDTLRARIREQLGEPTDEPEPSHAVMKSVPKEERITIIINESDTDKQPVQVGLNGRSFVMQRGKPVSVPKGVIEILNHAVKTVWNSDMSGYTDVKRYPYTVVV